MTRVLLGALVAAMLALAGLVSFHAINSPDVPPLGDSPCCTHATAGCPADADEPACPAAAGCCAGEAGVKKAACCQDQPTAAAGEAPCCKEKEKDGAKKAEAGETKD